MLFRTLRMGYRYQLNLHPYLADNLMKQGLMPLRTPQLKTLDLLSQHSNIFINEVDSSGKTLAYLIPILQRIISNREDKQPQSGAIIVTLSKELSLQIYRLIRLIDASRRVKVIRSGSIAHYSPVIDEMCKPAKQQDGQLIVDLMDTNVAKAVQWTSTDILVTTPKMLYRILQNKIDRREPVTPQFLILDEADVVLGSGEMRTYMKTNLQYLYHFLGDRKLKYILAAPEGDCLKKDKGGINLPKAQTFEFTDHCADQSILQHLKVFYIKIKGLTKEQKTNSKLNSLVRLLSNPDRKRVLVYCQKENMDAIRTAILTKTDLKPSQIYGSLSTEQRMLTLFNFRQGVSNILLSTDLTSRGLDFGQPIDSIISFDLQEKREELARMCRTNKHQGQYIALITEEEQALFIKICDNKGEGELGRHFPLVPSLIP